MRTEHNYSQKSFHAVESFSEFITRTLLYVCALVVSFEDDHSVRLLRSFVCCFFMMEIGVDSY